MNSHDTYLHCGSDSSIRNHFFYLVSSASFAVPALERCCPLRSLLSVIRSRIILYSSFSSDLFFFEVISCELGGTQSCRIPQCSISRLRPKKHIGRSSYLLLHTMLTGSSATSPISPNCPLSSHHISWNLMRIPRRAPSFKIASTNMDVAV